MGGDRSVKSSAESSANRLYSPFGEIIPNLTNLALKHTNFSSTPDTTNANIVGGFIQNNKAVNTVTGIIGLLCGIPLSMPFYRNDFIHEYFLDSAICVSDVLNKLQYRQIYFAGTNTEFAGKKYLFRSHSVEVMDLVHFQQQNLLPNPLPENFQGFWDLKDIKLFELVKNTLDSLQEPFAAYIMTVDTHAQIGFVDREQCKNASTGYRGAIQCTDKIISDFVKWLQNSRFRDNTTIIIVGDHLSHELFFFPPNTKRFVYNAFINPQFTRQATLELTKNRTLSHFDIAPLILDSLGIPTQAFGLGRNPLYGATLLEGEFDMETLNKLMWQRNEMYNEFWKIKAR